MEKADRFGADVETLDLHESSDDRSRERTIEGQRPGISDAQDLPANQASLLEKAARPKPDGRRISDMVHGVQHATTPLGHRPRFDPGRRVDDEILVLLHLLTVPGYAKVRYLQRGRD